MRYEQFKFRQGIPGIDYLLSDSAIEGPPSPLKEALSEIAEALSLLELGDPQEAASMLGRILRRHGLNGDCDHPEIIPGAFRGCVAVRTKIELDSRRRQFREEQRAKEEKREARRLRALQGGKK